MSLLQTPDNWNSELLENLLVHIIGGDWGKDPDHQEKDYQAVACIRGSEFRNWSKESGRTAVLRKVKANSLDKRSLLPGDILLEISGGGPDQPVGRTVLINQAVLDQFDIPVVGTNFLRLLRPSAALDQRFLNKYLELFYSSGEVIKYQGGSNNLRNLKFKEYSQISVPVPPLAEQKVIADQLDTLLAQVETTKARLERIPQILKRFRQSVLAAAVSGRLTEEWRHHSRLPNPTDGKLSDCIENMIGGASPRTSDYSNTGMLALNKGDIKEYGRIEGKRNPKYVPLDFVENNSKKVIPDGTLVVTLRDLSQKADFLGLIGRYRGQERALITQGMYGLKVKPHVATEDYLIAFSNSPQYRAQVKKEKVGATQVHLRNGQFLDLAVPLFVIEEQTEIVLRVGQLFAHADRIEQQVNNALARVTNLSQSILAKAFRGELTEQWRKDNPELISGENSAEALLERIKAERAAAKPKRRKANA